MSAIDKDREIAAKATQGEWEIRALFPPLIYGKHSHVLSVPLNPPMISEDAEHIVRLHNRQPLYDALVDAVRGLCHPDDRGSACFSRRTVDGPEVVHDIDCPISPRHTLGESLAALDQEETP